MRTRQIRFGVSKAGRKVRVRDAARLSTRAQRESIRAASRNEPFDFPVYTTMRVDFKDADGREYQLMRKGSAHDHYSNERIINTWSRVHLDRILDKHADASSVHNTGRHLFAIRLPSRRRSAKEFRFPDVGEHVELTHTTSSDERRLVFTGTIYERHTHRHRNAKTGLCIVDRFTLK